VAYQMAKRPVRIGAVLSTLVLVALLPSVVVLAFVVWRIAATDQAAANAGLQDYSSSLADIFHSGLDANLSIARRFVELGGEDGLAAFPAIAGYKAAKVAISDSELASPIGWQVGNLSDPAPGETPLLTIDISLSSSDGVPRTLQALVAPQDLVDALRFERHGVADAMIAVVDGNGRIIARSEDEQKYIGARVPNWDALLAVGAPSGTFSAERLEGGSISFGFSQIRNTPGWVVVVGIPAGVLAARWIEPLLILGGGTLVALLTAAFLARALGNRIAIPIRDLAAYAQRSHPGASPPEPTRIAELETLRQSFVSAQTVLLNRAHHDDLTGLPNRSQLRERLSYVIPLASPDGSAALLYVDLDRFKQANDTHGHRVGDDVLRLVAARLSAALRPGDLAARLGGDEFAVLLRDANAIDAARAAAGRIVDTMRMPFEIGAVSVHLGASVGIVVIDHGVGSVDEVIEKADQALYAAKSAGRGRYVIHGDQGNQRLSA
jgi:diguanylate cyclase (GGDEF)-like protein